MPVRNWERCIKRLLDENNKHQYKLFYHKILNRYGGKLVFESNLNDYSIKQMTQDNTFLFEVLQAWSEINRMYTNTCASKIILWNNADITINGSTIYYDSWSEKGIKFVQHIFDYRTKEYYTFEEMKRLYGLLNADYLKYYQLTASIPRIIKTKINEENPENIKCVTLVHKVMNSNIKSNSLLYKLHIQHSNVQHDRGFKWNNILINSKVEQDEWKKIFIIPHTCSIDTTLRSFQFKYIYRIIPTNKYLHRVKLTSSSLCQFCSETVETLEHLFWECRIVQHLWNNLKELFSSINVHITLDLKTISFGYLKKPNCMIINFLIVLMKYFIYGMKLREVIPNFQGFRRYISLRYKIEYDIAFNSGKLARHEQKWHALNEKLNLSTAL